MAEPIEDLLYGLLSHSLPTQVDALFKYLVPLPKPLVDGNVFLDDLRRRGADLLEDPATLKLFEEAVEFAKTSLGRGCDYELVGNYFNAVSSAYVSGAAALQNEALQKENDQLKGDLKRLESYARLVEGDNSKMAKKLAAMTLKTDSDELDIAAEMANLSLAADQHPNSENFLLEKERETAKALSVVRKARNRLRRLRKTQTSAWQRRPLSSNCLQLSSIT
ncbi:hypothetical protein QR680_007753 [Steinernema hermaphroditum]|uniref:Uncharacterized protein n=1 Tax=Steinernema hermaphroditum TaxID=289476 RepID=A0AA39IGM1_9BILA|nr:hypothetical protein QR680_007753 [Steinernema hermaphroditum]